ncbi:MAG: hypothetical protein H0T79_16450, partial [Deltaproteobacteria bacterium]|nr:hypothetical protein [Deltaproteobacteria bacterium]
MLTGRIIVIASDDAFGHQLATALQPASALTAGIEVHHTIDALGAGELHAALYVIHIEDALPGALWARLHGPVITVLQRANLAAAVDVMQSGDRVAGMMVADDFDPHHLTAMATRILTDDVFGLEAVMAAGTQIHSQSVRDYREKSQCMAHITQFVEQSGAPRSYREPIDQCIDEMLMNALSDAPVDARGKHVFAGVPTRQRITMRT